MVQWVLNNSFLLHFFALHNLHLCAFGGGTGTLTWACTLPSRLWAVSSYVPWPPTVVAGYRATGWPGTCSRLRPLRAKVGLVLHNTCCLGTDCGLLRMGPLVGGRVTSLGVGIGSPGMLSLDGSLVGSLL